MSDVKREVDVISDDKIGELLASEKVERAGYLSRDADEVLRVLTRVVRESTVLRELTMRSIGKASWSSVDKFRDALKNSRDLALNIELDTSFGVGWSLVWGYVSYASLRKLSLTGLRLYEWDCCLGIDEEACKDLGDMLASTTTLLSLSVACTLCCVAPANIAVQPIGDKGALQVVCGVMRNSSLRVLELYQCGIGPEGCKALGAMLLVNSTLEELHMTRLTWEENIIKDAGAKEIAAGLARNSSLRILTLGRAEVGPEGAVALGNMLAVNSTLERLSLRNWVVNSDHNRIGASGVAGIADGLARNSSLRVLDLFRCRVGPEGAASLATMLAINSTLQELCLGGIWYDDSGAVALADGLAQNATLRVLNLGECHIFPEGASAMARMLSLNATLTDLNLSDGRIEDSGAVALADGLTQNATLRVLNLRSCCIGPQGAAALSTMLSLNATLTDLNLDHNRLEHRGMAKLYASLKHNSSICRVSLQFCQ